MLATGTRIGYDVGMKDRDGLALCIEPLRAGLYTAGVSLEAIGDYYRDARGINEEEEGLVLEERLLAAGRQLLVVLDAFDLTDTKSHFIGQLDMLIKDGALRECVAHEYESHNRIYSLVRDVIDGLGIIAEVKPLPQLEDGHRRLEGILRATPRIVHKRKVTPSKEHDIQDIVHEHLEVEFYDFVKNPTIDGPITPFKPDCGVRSLGAAIEVKFVDSAEEAKVAMRGIFEDLSGYTGSKDWTSFYSLIYMTAPFMLEGTFSGAIAATGNGANWKTIVVNGAGERKRRTASAAVPAAVVIPAATVPAAVAVAPEKGTE